MSNNPVNNYGLTNFNNMDSTTYKSYIDGNFAMLQREGGKFAPQQNIICIQNLVLDPGHLMNGTTMTQLGAYGLIDTTTGSPVVVVEGGSAAMNGIAVGMFLLPIGPSYGNVVGNVATGVNTITGIVTSTAWPVGANISGPNLPGGTTITGISAGVITLSNNASGNTTNGVYTINNFNPMCQTPSVASIAGNNVTLSSSTGFPNSIATLTGFPVKFCLATPGSFAPITTNPRLDRVVIDASTGAVSVITGTEGVTPVPPAIPTGKYPIAQVLMTSTTSGTITNNMIYDERDFSQPYYGQTPSQTDVSNRLATTAFCQQNETTGMQNRLLNPNFLSAQRGASGSVTTGVALIGPDGWYIQPTGATVTWQAEYGNIGAPPNLGATNLGGGFLQLTGNTSMTQTLLVQNMESYLCDALAGYPCTFQVVINNTTGATITPQLFMSYANSQDNFGSLTAVLASTNLQSVPNNSSVQLAYTVQMPIQCINGIEIGLAFGSALNANTKSITMGRLDFRPTPGCPTGLNANPPPAEVRPLQLDLPMCQRQFIRFNAINGDAAFGPPGQCISTTQALLPLKLPVRMRAAPSLSVSAAGHFSVTAATSGRLACTALSLQANPTVDTVVFNATVASGLVAGNATTLWSANASGTISLSSEL